eukprot:gene161-191_t
MRVPPAQKTYYDELFALADGDHDGVIGINDASFFRKSSLPDESLREIWQLSDVKNGVLELEDFFVALKLISLAQMGAPISLDSIRAMPVVPPPKLQDVAPLKCDWTVPQSEKNNYIEIFNKNDEDSDGYINGVQAKTLFSSSGLPIKILGHIWYLADMNGDQKLDCQEFIIATFLIRSVLKGYDLPGKLPEPLISSSHYIGSAGVPSPKVPEWLIPPAERIIYEDIFNKNQQGGFISGGQARVLFEKSGLVVQDLKVIWDLADYNQEQRLDKQKFVIAMFLISQRKKKKELPTTLPAVLLESSKSSFHPQSPPSVDIQQHNEATKSGKYNIDLDDIFIEESQKSIELQGTLQAESNKLEEVIGQIKEYEEKLSAQKQLSLELRETISSTRIDVKSYKTQLEQTMQRVKEKTEQFEEESELLVILQNDLQEKQTELERYKQEVDQLTASIDAIKSQRTDTKNEMVHTNKAITDTKADVKRLNEEFKQLKTSSHLSSSSQLSSSSLLSPPIASVAPVVVAAPVAVAEPKSVASDDGWSLFETISVSTATPPPKPAVAVAPVPQPSPTKQAPAIDLKTSTSSMISNGSANNNNFFTSGGSSGFFDEKFTNTFSSGDDQFSFGTFSDKNNPFAVVGDDTSSSSHKADAGSEVSSSEHTNLFGNGFDTFDAFASAKDPFGSSLFTGFSSTSRDSFTSSFTQPIANTTTTNNNNNIQPATTQVPPPTTTTTTTGNQPLHVFDDKPSSENGSAADGFEDSFDTTFPMSTITVPAENTPFNTPSNSVTANDIFGGEGLSQPTSTGSQPPPASSFFFDDNAFSEKFTSGSGFSTTFDDSNFA